MSKTIYDEALEKINIEFDAWERSEKIEVIELIEEALEQAQKQEKLLGLYKEHFRLSNIPKSAFNFIYVFNRLLEIKNEIKELEVLLK